MKTYNIKPATTPDGSENVDGQFDRVEAVSARAARRQYRKKRGMHPTRPLICEPA